MALTVLDTRFFFSVVVQSEELSSEDCGICIYKFPARYGVGQNEDGYHSRPLSIHFGFICATQNIIYAYIVELS